MDSQLKFCIEILVIGGESGGVTGALFEILRGGSDGMYDWRMNKKGFEDILASSLDGLGKEEDDGVG